MFKIINNVIKTYNIMACNCNENTNCYHISMGCVEPALANPNAYYTKSEVDEKLEEIISSGCCISPEEVDEKIDTSLEGYATEQWVEDKHYITGVDLSNYALKEEIPDINGYATEAWVNNQGFLKTHQSLEGYATQTWVQNQGYLTQHQPLNDYATKQWVEDKHYLTQHQDLSNYALKTEIPDISGLASETYVNNYTYDKATIDQKVAQGGTFDPSQYYTTAQTYNKTEVDNLIPTVPTNVSDFNNDAGYLTSHQPIKTINGNQLVGYGNVHLDIPKIWHGTKAEYEMIENKDADTIYLLYES